MGNHRGIGAIGAGVLAAGVLLLTACTSSVTAPAGDVSDTSATFNGSFNDDTVENAEHWFEYGTTTSYGSSTPHRTTFTSTANTSTTVNEAITGLTASTTYHVRLCSQGADGHGG